jgi:hypothetical protein
LQEGRGPHDPVALKEFDPRRSERGMKQAFET